MMYLSSTQPCGVNSKGLALERRNIMAYGDTYTTEDGVEYTVAPRPAQANVFVRESDGEDRLKLEDAERAEAAGVTSVEYIDYAEALQNYESRPDAEPLANRRARENAASFAEQDFMRETIDIAGQMQSSTIVGTSVPDGEGDDSVYEEPRGTSEPTPATEPTPAPAPSEPAPAPSEPAPAPSEPAPADGSPTV